jgi:hypothetical protein
MKTLPGQQAMADGLDVIPCRQITVRFWLATSKAVKGLLAGDVAAAAGDAAAHRPIYPPPENLLVTPMMIRLLLAICTALPLVACNATQSGGTSGAGAARSSAGSSSIPRGRTTITGNVERVWEDGFRLNTGGRSVNVDTWDVFGDGTRGRVSPGQRVSVTGELSGGEFDASAVNPL